MQKRQKPPSSTTNSGLWLEQLPPECGALLFYSFDFSALLASVRA
jgi:hypothetical protein